MKLSTSTRLRCNQTFRKIRSYLSLQNLSMSQLHPSLKLSPNGKLSVSLKYLARLRDTVRETLTR